MEFHAFLLEGDVARIKGFQVGIEICKAAPVARGLVELRMGSSQNYRGYL